MNDGPGSYVGPNALFTNSVPEGGSTLLLMAAAIAVVFVLFNCSPNAFGVKQQGCRGSC
jgi:hypothetical protein